MTDTFAQAPSSGSSGPVIRAGSASVLVNANSVASVSVTFSSALAATPIVVCTPAFTSSTAGAPQVTIGVDTVTTTGFRAFLSNPGASAFTITFYYLATAPV